MHSVFVVMRCSIHISYQLLYGKRNIKLSCLKQHREALRIHKQLLQLSKKTIPQMGKRFKQTVHKRIYKCPVRTSHHTCRCVDSSLQSRNIGIPSPQISSLSLQSHSLSPSSLPNTRWLLTYFPSLQFCHL